MPRKLPSIAKAPRLKVQCHDAHMYVSPERVVHSPAQVPTVQLIVMLSGKYSALWSHKGQREHVEASAGDVVFWPAGVYRTESKPQGLMRCMVRYIRWADQITGLPTMRHDDHRVIRALSDRLLRLTDTRTHRQQALINTYAAAMLAEYISLCGEAGEHQLPHQVGQYIRAHLRKRITLDILARHVGLEKHYFGRRYRELTGMTPMDAVRRLRIDRAVGIIRGAPGIPLKSVADRVGITNGNLLSRWIKKQLSLTATEIRR